jgi:hypothetical protein
VGSNDEALISASTVVKQHSIFCEHLYVLGSDSFDVHAVGHVRFKAFSPLGVCDSPMVIKSVVDLSQSEHVRVDASAEVLEWYS